MTAKETKIKEAWGKHWDKVKDFVDQDGSVMITQYDPHNIDDMYVDYYHWNIYAPQSLRGISHNNGWITIESEKDLPSEVVGLCWVMLKDGTIDYADSQLLTSKEVRNYWAATVTHYQPIVKPKPPIY